MFILTVLKLILSVPASGNPTQILQSQSPKQIVCAAAIKL